MKKEQILKNQKGFTLIEIIAVLVILGILAAVAAPKYFELTTNAETGAIDTALGDAIGTLNQGYASYIVNTGNGTAPTMAQLRNQCGFTGAAATDTLVLGDFTFTATAAGTGDTVVTVTCTIDPYGINNRTKTINMTLN